jgi:uncharacterized membrane protein YfcA
MIELGVLLVSVVAGGVAGISGFGIGSLLTPLLAVHYGTKLAAANRGVTTPASLRMINARRRALCKAEVRSLLEGAR